MDKNHFFKIFVLILSLILLHSYIPTISEALSTYGSADFLWQPTKCVFNGINFYSSYLNNDGSCPKFMNDGGGYAQGFYIILYPFSFFEWKTAKLLWFLLNIILLTSTVYILCKKFELNKFETFLILFFILYCIITRVNLVMGQHTIFILFFLSLPFVYNSKLSTFLSGICYFKYNIGYGLFLLYLLSKEYKKTLISILPVLLGVLLFCLITDTNILENIFQPLQLMFYNQKVGATLTNLFLFSFIRDFSMFSTTFAYSIIIILTLLFNLYFIIKISKIKNNLLKLSCLLMLILISTPHWGHDYILIIPLLIYSMKNYSSYHILYKINLFICIYFLYLYSGLQTYINLLLRYFQFNTDILSNVYSYIDILILLMTLVLNLYCFSSNNTPKKKLG